MAESRPVFVFGQAAAMACKQCGFTDNGELTDFCGGCGESLGKQGAASRRQLRLRPSHEDAPPKQAAKVDNAAQAFTQKTPGTASQQQHDDSKPNDKDESEGDGDGKAEVGMAIEDEEEDADDDEDVKGMFKTMLKMMKQVKRDVKDVKKDVGSATTLAQQAKRTAEAAQSSAEATKKEVQELRDSAITKHELPGLVKQIIQESRPLETGSTSHSPGKAATDTAVFKGFAGELDQAEEWITKQLRERQLPEPEEMYIKGDTFKGMVFARFRNPGDMMKVVNVGAKVKFGTGDQEIQCNPERPIEERAPVSLMLGLRWQLSQWGTFAKIT